MQCSQLDILEGALACLEAGEKVSLASVVKTWGSSPRPVGSLLVVSSSGRFFGSVSGGCVEDDLVERLKNNPVLKPEYIFYGASEEETTQFNLPCGSVLQLLIEPLVCAQELKELVRAITERKALCRVTSIKSGQSYLRPYSKEECVSLTEDSWTNIFGPVWRLVIVGAGEPSLHLAKMALMLGFSVLVIEPRLPFRELWPLPEVPLLSGLPDDALLALQPDERTAVAALSHDPRIDDMVLIEALRSKAFYVGALGSKRNNDKRRQRLIEHFDFSVEQLRRLDAPIGIAIGSKTPAEIALSALAAITAERSHCR